MEPTLTQRFELSRIRDQEGFISGRISYDIPSNVSGLSMTIPSGSGIDDRNGFRGDTGSQLRWDGQTEDPHVEITVQVNQTGAGRGGARVDTGEWAIVTKPNVMTQWQSRGSKLSFERVTEVDDRGVASSDGALVYLGPYKEHSRGAGGQLIRLIVPEAASLAERPYDILDSLAFAAGVLQVGGRNDEVVAIAAPTRPVSWGPGGLQAGANGFWVRDSARLTTPNNAWIHEYVHTRQEFNTTVATKWLVEATAVYYATTLPYRMGNLSDSEYYAALNTSRCASDVLGSPRAWSSAHVPYQKGSRVVAWLDSEIRPECGSTFEDVFESLNESTTGDDTGHWLVQQLVDGDVEPVDYDDLLGLLADTKGLDRRSRRFQRLKDDLDTYVKGPEVPEESPPPRLDKKPAGKIPDPHMPTELSDVLERAFGDAFGEEIVDSDGKLDEGKIFSSDDVGEGGVVALGDIFEESGLDPDDDDVEVRVVTSRLGADEPGDPDHRR